MEQRRELEWLAQSRRGAERARLRVEVRDPRHHDQRDAGGARVGLAGTAEAPSVEQGRDEIEQDRVWNRGRGIEQLERFGTISGLLHFVAELAEHLGDFSSTNAVIFDQKHTRHQALPSIPFASTVRRRFTSIVKWKGLARAPAKP